MVTRLSVTSRLVPGWVVSGSMGAGPFSVSCWVSGVWEIGDGGRISRTSSLPLNTLYREIHTCIRFESPAMSSKTCSESNIHTDCILPSIFRGGPRYVVKFNFPANTLFIRLNGDDFARIPLLIDTYFDQQTLIWRRKYSFSSSVFDSHQ